MLKRMMSHVGILSKKFHNEYDGEFLILKRWHFPVYCPWCKVVFNKLEDLTEAPIWPGTTEVCPACADTMILNYEEPKPITQRDVDGCGFLIDQHPELRALGFFGLPLEFFRYLCYLANPENEHILPWFLLVLATSPLWVPEIYEWIYVFFLC